MAGLTIELPTQTEQTEFNLRRWEELCMDRELAKFPGKIETDRFGRAIMMPPASPFHGGFQTEIAYWLRTLLRDGKVIVECPISTADGVRAADVAWASRGRLAELKGAVCFSAAPEICVEVISPDNSKAEMAEKAALYFDAGAKEVWRCEMTGEMKFFEANSTEPMKRSRLCPKFPKRIKRIDSID